MEEEKGNGWLLIDGAYLSYGIKSLKEKKILEHNFLLTKENIKLMINRVEIECNIKFSKQYYFNAEEKDDHKYNIPLHINLEYNQITVDIREMKSKSRKCKCGHEYQTKVQAEVSVAIATHMCLAASRKKVPVRRVVLLTGNRDYKASILYLDEHHIPVSVLGFRDSISAEYNKIAIYLDEILPHLHERPKLGVPPPPGKKHLFSIYIYIEVIKAPTPIAKESGSYEETVKEMKELGFTEEIIERAIKVLKTFDQTKIANYILSLHS